MELNNPGAMTGHNLVLLAQSLFLFLVALMTFSRAFRQKEPRA